MSKHYFFIFIFFIKGTLDKSNIYLFISSSIKNCKSKLYRKFQFILPMRFHFMRYFVNNIIFRVCHSKDSGHTYTSG